MKDFIKFIAFCAIFLSLGLIAISVLSTRPVGAQLTFGGYQGPPIFCEYSGQFWIQVVNEYGPGSLSIISPYVFPGRNVAGTASALVPCMKIGPLGAPIVIGYGFQIILMAGSP